MNNYKTALNKTLENFKQMMPMVLIILLFVSLFNALIVPLIKNRFTGTVLDSVIGAFAGSIAAGNPVTSYIIGGDLLQQGISLVAITAFILTWVSVGFISLPAEIGILGKKFAIARNITSFVISIIASLAIILTLGILWKTGKYGY